MAVKQTMQIGEPVLRLSAAPVVPADKTAGFSTEILQLITDLKDTMQSENLVGLAAPQIGVSKQVFVSDNYGRELAPITNRTIYSVHKPDNSLCFT